MVIIEGARALPGTDLTYLARSAAVSIACVPEAWVPCSTI